MTMIEAGRNKYENQNTRFIDVKRTYDTELGTLWGGLWLRITGYPKIDLDDYQTTTSGYANEAFSTGVETGLKLQ